MTCSIDGATNDVQLVESMWIAGKRGMDPRDVD